MKRIYRILLSVSALLLLSSLLMAAPVSAAIPSEAQFAKKIASLKSTFKDGEYWNYYNSKDYSKTGETPCPSCTNHKYQYCLPDCADSCGQFYLDGKWYGGQCVGFALKMCYLTFGSNPKTAWTKITSPSQFFAGDYARIRNDSHSIFITKVDGDTITYADCNWDGPCMVKWDKTISKTDLLNKLTYVYHLNGNNLTGVLPPTPVFPKKITLYKGVKCSFLPEGYSIEDLNLKKTVLSRKGIVKVSKKKGTITGLKAGKVRLTVTEGTKKSVITITVKKPIISLNKTKKTIYAGSTFQLDAAVKGKSNKVTWKSSNKKVATVSKNGLVKAKKAGKVTITAKANGVKATCSIKVRKKKKSKSTKTTDTSLVFFELKEGETYSGYDITGDGVADQIRFSYTHRSSVGFDDYIYINGAVAEYYNCYRPGQAYYCASGSARFIIVRYQYFGSQSDYWAYTYSNGKLQKITCGLDESCHFDLAANEGIQKSPDGKEIWIDSKQKFTTSTSTFPDTCLSVRMRYQVKNGTIELISREGQSLTTTAFIADQTVKTSKSVTNYVENGITITKGQTVYLKKIYFGTDNTYYYLSSAKGSGWIAYTNGPTFSAVNP